MVQRYFVVASADGEKTLYVVQPEDLGFAEDYVLALDDHFASTYSPGYVCWIPAGVKPVGADSDYHFTEDFDVRTAKAMLA